MNYEYNGRTIYAGRSWTDDMGVKYPSNWASRLTDDEKSALGLIKIPDKPKYDSRFYFSYNTPRPLDDTPVTDENGDPVLDPDTGAQQVYEGLKSQFIKEIKETAGVYLAATDWMVVRSVELPAQKPIPSDLLTQRGLIRDESDRIEQAIKDSTTIEELKAALDSANWPS